MFSSALKSLSSGITSNYTIAPQPSSTAGPWKIYDAKRKQTGKAVSVFVFDRKSLEPTSGGLASSRGSGGLSLKKAHEEVIERLKREASSLARLRHPSILELAEPVEETRNGGLMFATEPVTASLASLLREKDEQGRSGGTRGRSSRYVVEEEENGTRRKREVEIDELEIQKGLLQLAKGLDFLHESAGLVHANLTPEAVLVNTKGDWKIAGLAFCGPHESSTAATSLAPISLHEVLNHDPRLPRIVQLDIDYTSPDFVLDNTLTAASDMFSLGLLIVALYNTPHKSPISAGGSLSAYKRIFASSSTIPTRTNNFLVSSTASLPANMASDVLPRLITRRPAQRLGARKFQEASYFDNILVSTIRFLESLPAKTLNEKSQFLRGLPKIMPQFPKSVLEKKLLPTLLEEMKDPDLLAPIITNIFAMLKSSSALKGVFSDTVLPRFREVFVGSKGAERDSAKDAGLVVVLENIGIAAQNCTGKEFREDILPIILVALDSPTLSIVDAALSTLPHVISVLDFSTIKNEVFPAVATVFAKTSSLNIKIRGLEAFHVLCGGSSDASTMSDAGLNGFNSTSTKSAQKPSTAILDKFTIQERIVPLLKGIKTKEPGVMLAALKVFDQISGIVDTDFLAMDVLPIMWSMSLGPLLDLSQFQAFMKLIKTMSERVEKEQTRKLRELAGSGKMASARPGARNGVPPNNSFSAPSDKDVDFETLVSGRKTGNNGGDLMNDWGTASPSSQSAGQTSFSWQSSNGPISASQQALSPMRSPSSNLNTFRTITPDQSVSSFGVLQPQPLQPQHLQPALPPQQMMTSNLAMRPQMASSQPSIDWSAATKSQQPNYTISPSNYTSNVRPSGGFNLPPPPTSSNNTIINNNNGFGQIRPNQPSFGQSGVSQTASSQKTGLDKYESLI